jgi:hypothetical protein
VRVVGVALVIKFEEAEGETEVALEAAAAATRQPLRASDPPCALSLRRRGSALARSPAMAGASASSCKCFKNFAFG